jgi:hypothetical protein
MWVLLRRKYNVMHKQTESPGRSARKQSNMQRIFTNHNNTSKDQH